MTVCQIWISTKLCVINVLKASTGSKRRWMAVPTEQSVLRTISKSSVASVGLEWQLIHEYIENWKRASSQEYREDKSVLSWGPKRTRPIGLVGRCLEQSFVWSSRTSSDLQRFEHRNPGYQPFIKSSGGNDYKESMAFKPLTIQEVAYSSQLTACKQVIIIIFFKSIAGKWRYFMDDDCLASDESCVSS